MSETKKEDWMQNKWRPAMGWLYMCICAFDFVIFPILWNIAQATYLKNILFTQWQPLTLQGAGFFHIAMGAVLGLSAYGRSQEKIASTNHVVTPTATPTIISKPTKVEDSAL